MNQLFWNFTWYHILSAIFFGDRMMLKLLKQDWPVEALTAAFAELGISTMERAEKLGLEQFTALTKILHP